MIRVFTQSKKLKENILVAFDRKNVGWKMVYNFLGIDEKKIEKSTYIQSEYPYSVFESLSLLYLLVIS